jgi:hypothetical protein
MIRNGSVSMTPTLISQKTINKSEIDDENHAIILNQMVQIIVGNNDRNSAALDHLLEE